jgi:hypothetical protein
VLERLVEYWLDSVNERTYQPAFIQMLVSDGHRILHSTRHAPIEFGKDVITVAPDGVPCAYQLKGNPSGRLTHSQFREILPQIQELVTMSIAHPSAPAQNHRSYLVTNGFIEEEVQRAISDLNIGWERQGRPPNSLHVIDRGEFLRLANALGPAIWPFNIQNLNAFMELLAHDGRDELPVGKLTVMLESMYELEAENPLAARLELDRRASSTAVLISVSLRNFGIRENHFAVITAWTLYITHTIAACGRANLPISTTIQNSIAAARAAILDSLSDLTDEAIQSQHLIEGDVISDAPFYHARVTLLAALASVYLLWCDREAIGNSNIPRILEFVSNSSIEKSLWGEAVVPQILARSWGTGKGDHGRAEQFVVDTLITIVGCQAGEDGFLPLASPYFHISAVVLWQLGLETGFEDGDVGKSNFGHSAHFAEPLLILAVRAGLKELCQAVWPLYTKLVHQSFEVEEPWQYCLVRAERGVNHSVVPVSARQWADLQAAAAEIATPKVPDALRADPLLLLLFTIIAPHRATPDVVRYLDWCFNDVWQLPHPRPTA